MINILYFNKYCGVFITFSVYLMHHQEGKMKENYISLFERTVSLYKDDIALQFQNQSITYYDLNHKADILASYLVSECDIKNGEIVGVALERGIDLVISYLALFKIGAAFLPIDLTWPKDRSDYIIFNSKIKSIICKNYEKDFKNIIILDDKIFSNEKTEYKCDSNPDDIAYVIYTSGTTGNPKGVIIEQKGMLNHIMAKIEDFNIDKNSIVAQNSSHCFDISVWQLLTALLVGGKVVIYPRKIIMNVKKFINCLVDDKITVLEVVPSYLNILIDTITEDEIVTSKLKYVISTGEPLKYHTVDRFFSKIKNITLANAYGPTEASDDITHAFFNSTPSCNSITVGKPIRNAEIRIYKHNNELCDVNEEGEIWVSGICVGKGYLFDEKKNNERFLIDSVTGDRIYKTGDVGYFDENGFLFVNGRIDNQIKLSGHRIELEDIENNISRLEYIKDNVVVITENNNLVCFYVSSDDFQEDIQFIKNELKKYIPSYMIPHQFKKVFDLKVTDNGKINRSFYQNLVINENSNDANIIEILEEKMNLQISEEIKTRPIEELGIDSLKYIEMLVELEEAFLIEFDENDINIENQITIEKLIQMISKKL